MPLLIELKRYNKIHKYNDKLVDEKEEEIKKMESNKDFDDPHIIALAILSKAKIICSDDSRSFKFIRKIKKYNCNCNVPQIYTTKEHTPQTTLLCESNICSNREHQKLKKKMRKNYGNVLKELFLYVKK